MSSELTSSVSSLLTAVHGALNVNIYFYKHKVPFYLDIYICNILNITHNVQCTVYVLNCFKVSESNNSDVRGFLWSSCTLHNFFKWYVFRSIPPLTHHEFGKW